MLAVRLVLGASALCAAGVAVAEAKRAGQANPAYDAGRIYALSFHGIRLGMTFEQACKTLIDQGYSRRPSDFPDDPPCSPKHLMGENREIYFGKGWKNHAELAGKPARNVQSVSIVYLMRNGMLTVNEIEAYTDEPKQETELARRAVEDWGVPTADDKWSYRVMTYAPSAKQADFYHRDDFQSCLIWNGCNKRLSGPACYNVLHRYAVPFAKQVIHGWGRVVTIADGRRSLGEARRTGHLDKLLARDVGYACPVPTIH